MDSRIKNFLVFVILPMIFGATFIFHSSSSQLESTTIKTPPEQNKFEIGLIKYIREKSRTSVDSSLGSREREKKQAMLDNEFMKLTHGVGWLRVGSGKPIDVKDWICEIDHDEIPIAEGRRTATCLIMSEKPLGETKTDWSSSASTSKYVLRESHKNIEIFSKKLYKGDVIKFTGKIIYLSDLWSHGFEAIVALDDAVVILEGK